MDKEKAAEALRKRGYNVKVLNGILQFFYPDGIMDYNGYARRIAEELKGIDYNSSWGCRYSKEESKPLQENFKVEETEEEEDEEQ